MCSIIYIVEVTHYSSLVLGKNLHVSEPRNESGNEASSPPERSTTLMTASYSIIQELDRQLEGWRVCLPQGLEFPTYSIAQEQATAPSSPRPTMDRLRGHLMARYYACKSIIHRPFLYQALNSTRTSNLLDAFKSGARTTVGAGLLSCIHSGFLNEPLTLLLHPINTCRRCVKVALSYIGAN